MVAILSQSDDDVVVCLRGIDRPFFTRAEMYRLRVVDIDNIVTASTVLLSFSNFEGITWLSKTDTLALYPNWAGHKDDATE